MHSTSSLWRIVAKRKLETWFQSDFRSGRNALATSKTRDMLKIAQKLQCQTFSLRAKITFRPSPNRIISARKRSSYVPLVISAQKRRWLVFDIALPWAEIGSWSWITFCRIHEFTEMAVFFNKRAVKCDFDLEFISAHLKSLFLRTRCIQNHPCDVL